MNKFRKILCVVLSLIMVASIFAINVSAVTFDKENAAKINVKYGVKQVASVTNMAGDTTYDAVDNNIYAVTIYAKAAYGLNYFQVPIHYDQTKFAPLMFVSADPYNEGALGYDGYYGDMAECGVYDWGYGDAWGSTSMYKVGYTATTTVKAQARFIGLGNKNAANVDPLIQYYDSTNPAYAKFTTNMDTETYGVVSFTLDNVGNSKNSYFNAYEGKVQTDYYPLGTVYFLRQDGVSEAEAVGSEFGITLSIADGLYGSQGLWDTSGNPSYFANTYAEGNPGLAYVANAVVEKAEEPFPSPSIVNHLRGQIRFNKNENNKLTSFDVRAMAVISKEDFESKFAAGEEAEAPGVIKDIGFVFAAASNGVDLTYENVKKVVEGGETVTGYAKKEVTFISTTLDSPNYVFTCMVTGMGKDDYSDKLLAVAYIAYADADGNAVYCYYPAVQEVSYKDLIDKWYGSSFSTDFAE